MTYQTISAIYKLFSNYTNKKQKVSLLKDINKLQLKLGLDVTEDMGTVTGPHIAGTGDDSSTVKVRKRKKVRRRKTESKSFTIDLHMSQDTTGIDFGYWFPYGNISGFVWKDADKDATKDDEVTKEVKNIKKEIHSVTDNIKDSAKL